jgi:hypothetical protein
VYSESRYIPYHQHGEVQIYKGANAAGALTVMGGDLLAEFIADLVDLYKFFYHDSSNGAERKPEQMQSDSNVQKKSSSQDIGRNKCSSCGCQYVEGDLYCSFCGKKLGHGGEDRSKWRIICQKCKRELPSEYVDAQNSHCMYCGSKTIKFYH